MRNCIGEFFIYNENIAKTGDYNKAELLSGKPLYEVMAFYNKKLVFLDEHLERLEQSAKLGGLNLWVSIPDIRKYANELLSINAIEKGSITIVLNYDTHNTFVAFINQHDSFNPDFLVNGIKTGFYFKERENPNIKVFNHGFRSAAEDYQQLKDFFEVILVDKNGFITEGSRSNVFMIRDKTVYTSPVKHVLPGITRKHIINICKKLNLDIQLKEIPYEEISSMDAVFITGTTSLVMPVKQIDEYKFDARNDLMLKIQDSFIKEIADVSEYQIVL